MLIRHVTLQEARQLRQTGTGGPGGADQGGAAAGRHQIDIDSLAFTEGSHTMSNKDCALPTNSYRTSFKVSKSSTSQAIHQESLSKQQNPLSPNPAGQGVIPMWTSAQQGCICYGYLFSCCRQVDYLITCLVANLSFEGI